MPTSAPLNKPPVNVEMFATVTEVGLTPVWSLKAAGGIGGLPEEVVPLPVGFVDVQPAMITESTMHAAVKVLGAGRHHQRERPAFSLHSRSPDWIRSKPDGGGGISGHAAGRRSCQRC